MNTNRTLSRALALLIFPIFLLSGCSNDPWIGDKPWPLFPTDKIFQEIDAAGGQHYIEGGGEFTVCLITEHELSPAPTKEGDWFTYDIQLRKESFDTDMEYPFPEVDNRPDALFPSPLSETVEYDWVAITNNTNHLILQVQPNPSTESRTLNIVYVNHYPFIYNNFISIVQKGVESKE